MPIPRMRTIQQCVKYFREQDPETAVNEYQLRKLLKNNENLSIKTGTKYLINLDKLIEYYNSDFLEEDDEPEIKETTIRKFTGIRAVPE